MIENIKFFLPIILFIGTILLIIFGVRAIRKTNKGTNPKNNNGNKDQKPPWEG